MRRPIALVYCRLPGLRAHLLAIDVEFHCLDPAFVICQCGNSNPCNINDLSVGWVQHCNSGRSRITGRLELLLSSRLSGLCCAPSERQKAGQRDNRCDEAQHLGNPFLHALMLLTSRSPL